MNEIEILKNEIEMLKEKIETLKHEINWLKRHHALHRSPNIPVLEAQLSDFKIRKRKKLAAIVLKINP